MPITSVNLDQESKEIADRVGNFSGFVRECLRRWNAFDLGEHMQPRREYQELGKKCFPYLKKGCCVLCWPDGPPTSEDWKYYCEIGGKVVVGQTIDKNPIFEKRNYDNKWIEEKARQNNLVPAFPIPTDKTFKHSRESSSPPRGEGLIKRLLRVLRPQ